jgi:hypothetical protein
MNHQRKNPGARANAHTGPEVQSIGTVCAAIPDRCSACGQLRRRRKENSSRRAFQDFAQTPLGRAAEARELAAAPLAVRRVVSRYGLHVATASTIAGLAGLGAEVRHG